MSDRFGGLLLGASLSIGRCAPTLWARRKRFRRKQICSSSRIRRPNRRNYFNAQTGPAVGFGSRLAGCRRRRRCHSTSSSDSTNCHRYQSGGQCARAGRARLRNAPLGRARVTRQSQRPVRACGRNKCACLFVACPCWRVFCSPSEPVLPSPDDVAKSLRRGIAFERAGGRNRMRTRTGGRTFYAIA